MDRPGMAATIFDRNALPASGSGRVFRGLRNLFGLSTLCAVFGCLIIATFSGCTSLRLPQIDPTGQRIFLPYPEASTQCSLSDLFRPATTSPAAIPFNGPAFTTPALPPPCLQSATIAPPVLPMVPAPMPPLCVDDCFNGPPAVLVGNACSARDLLHLPEKGHRGRILLTPRRVIAPVGGEVVLLAGVCGEDGYLMMGEPIEWMLSPDSVGNLIQVGDDDRCMLHRISSRSPESGKVDGDFARGRTSTKPTLITRGTRNTRDDLQLKKGETWVSLSSPSEGVSRVTVLAPENDCWDHHKATTTIYWIDANWQFPSPPQVLAAGTATRLVTRVTRSETTIPAEGWIVRYEILTPTLAGFPPTNASVVEVPVDGRGEAVVNIAPIPQTSGTATIEIQIIRPAESDLPRMVLSKGETTITWAAPKLALQTVGPQIGGFEQPLTVVANVSNPGDLPAENVVLEAQLPPGVTYVSSGVVNTNSPGRVLWEIGTLPAHTQLDIDLTLRARSAFRLPFVARGSNVPAVDSVLQIDVFTPAVELKVTPTQERAEVGQDVTFNIDVTNIGNRPLSNVTLQADGDEGMTNLQRGRRTVTQVREQGALQPGETWQVGVTYVLGMPGQRCVQVTATAEGAQHASQESCVIATNPPVPTPSVTINAEATSEATIGSAALLRLRVLNDGRVPLNQVRVVAAYDARMQPFEALPAGDSSAMGRYQVSWTLPTLAPGQLAEILMNSTVLGPTGDASWIVTVESSEGAQARTDAVTRVLPAPITPPPVPVQPTLPPAQPIPAVPPPILPDNTATPPADVVPPRDLDTLPAKPPATSSNLVVSLTDRRDPTLVGENTPYTLTLQNTGNAPDQDVDVRILIPESVTLVSANQALYPSAQAPTFPFPGAVDLPRIATVRAGESISYELVLRPNSPQTMTIEVQVRSRFSGRIITETEQTEVRAR